MQGDKIISATLSSSVPLFLQVNYLQFTTKFTKTLFFSQFQSIIQAQQILYYSLLIPPLTHDMDPLRLLLSLLNTQPLLPRLHILWLNLILTPQSKPYFPVLMKMLTN